MLSIIQCMMIYGMIIAGGPINASGGNYGAACVGSPVGDANDDAQKLGRRVAQLCKAIDGKLKP